MADDANDLIFQIIKRRTAVTAFQLGKTVALNRYIPSRAGLVIDDQFDRIALSAVQLALNMLFGAERTKSGNANVVLPLSARELIEQRFVQQAFDSEQGHVDRVAGAATDHFDRFIKTGNFQLIVAGFARFLAVDLLDHMRAGQQITVSVVAGDQKRAAESRVFVCFAALQQHHAVFGILRHRC
ncbi:MAG: hypothetical protein ACRER2_11975 [Methylococcales bacterium]